MLKRYQTLLCNTLSDEQFTRQALGLLEAQLRELALLLLQDWIKTGIATDNSAHLIQAISGLSRPSFGSWNFLISILRSLYDNKREHGNNLTLKKLEQATVLEGLLQILDQNIKTPKTSPWIRQLYRINGQKPPKPDFNLQKLIADIPNTLRNQIAHNTPTDQDYWKKTSKVLKPLIIWLVDNPKLINLKPYSHLPPWFISSEEGILSYNGFNKQGSVVLYVNPKGVPKRNKENLHAILLGFQKTLGQTEKQLKDFQSLLNKYRPKALKGVLMGDFLVGRLVGKGAHGHVHKAQQLSTGRQVAIKFLNEGTSTTLFSRFKQEAALLSRLNHPNIVDIISYGEGIWHNPQKNKLKGEQWYEEFKKGSPYKTYIAMEWLEGQTLEDYYQQQYEKNESDFQQITAWFVDIADALMTVHNTNIIHRDIKPSNLMITAEGRIKLLDFGVAHSIDPQHSLSLTKIDEKIGTIAYRAPEQISAEKRTRKVGKAADIYGLSAVFYELYTQQRLYQHDRDDVDEETINTNKRNGIRPIEPMTIKESMPWELSTLLSIGLETEPTDRYKRIKDLKRDLIHYQKNEPIEQKQPTKSRRLLLWYRRHQKKVQLSGFFILLLIGTGTGYLFNLSRERDRAIRAEKETKTMLFNANYNLAKVFEEKSLSALKKGDENKDKTLTDYRNAWLYALEAKKLAILSGQIALKQTTLNKLSELSARALLPQLQATPEPLNLGGAVHIVAYSPDGHTLASGISHSIKLWNLKTGQLKQTLKGHKGWINELRYSPDGITLASASSDKSIKLWDLKTGHLKQTLKGHEKAINTLDYHPDGAVIVSASDDRTLKLWDAKTTQLKQTLKGHKGKVLAVRYSPNGLHIASASQDKTIKIWNANTGHIEHTLKGHNDTVNTLDYHPKGHMIASGSSDKTIKIWDTTTGELKQTLTGHEELINALRYVSEGRFIVSSGGYDESLRYWNAVTGELKQTIRAHKRWINTLSYNPKEGVVASGGADRTIKLWDITSGVLKQIVNQNPLEVQTLAVASHKPNTASVVPSSQITIKAPPKPQKKWINIQSHASNQAFTASEEDDHNIHLWDKKTAQLLHILKGHQRQVNIISVSPNSPIIASASDDQTIKLWDSLTGELKQTLKGHTNIIEALSYSPDGQRIVSGSADRTIKLWDSKTGQLKQTFKQHKNNIRQLKYSKKGQMVMASSRDTTRWWDTEKKPLKQVLKGHQKRVSALSYSPNADVLASVSNDRSIKLWDTKTGELKQTLKRSNDSKWGIEMIDALKYSPNGQVLASSGKHAINLWDVNTGVLKKTLQGHKNLIRCLEYSPDGKTIASGSTDGTIKLWDAKTGVLKQTLKGRSGPVYTLSYSPNRRTIASGSSSTIKLWDTKTGVLKQTLKGHRSTVYTLKYSPNGQVIISGSSDKTLKVWDANTGILKNSLQNDNAIHTLGYHPDGETIAFLGENQSIKQWNRITGEIKHISKGQKKKIRVLLYHPDGNSLASGSDDTNIRLWDKNSLITQDLLYQYDPHQVASALQFLWQMALDKDNLNFIDKVRTPSLYPSKEGYYYDEKLRDYFSLLNRPKENQNKADQLISWLQNQCAYQDKKQRDVCKMKNRSIKYLQSIKHPMIFLKD